MPNENYADVILPLPLPKPFTYSIPELLFDSVQVGKRVEVSFGKKVYSGLVLRLHQLSPTAYKTKPLLSVIDDIPIALAQQLQFWQWLADYYCCTIGEVMTAALPSNLKLNSETIITLNPLFQEDSEPLNDAEFQIHEALSLRQELKLEEIQLILNKKTISPVIRQMLDKGIIQIKEELKEKYKVKQVNLVRLHQKYLLEPELLHDAFNITQKAPKQMEALLAMIQLSKTEKSIRPQMVMDRADCENSVINKLVEKGIFEKYKQDISRVGTYDEPVIDAGTLSPAQVQCLSEIDTCFQDKQVTLLHGVTGSGKTRIYIELIREAIRENKQVLYLLPEIALTTQIINRLQVIFGNDIAVYHSKLNNQERVELWNASLAGKPVILGVRSALFLPFKNLALVIVDEEHDASFKQADPHPRYHARDAAIYLAHQYKAKVLLGTATPAMESYHNARLGKYGLVELNERFGGINMPVLELADIRDELKKRKMQAHFTSVLIDQMKAALEKKEQIILFQNRRGYAPVLNCMDCGWSAQCKSCDVALTYHRFTNNLHCHYCGYQTALVKECPACGSKKITTKGFGTERLEDEIAIYFPDASIARMDLDTVRTKNALIKIINDFEERRVDILVGTQMVTKGLDFDNVGIVGVISADQQLRQPDFRAAERAFQLITQVSGRAGRKSGTGKVIIQTYEIAHPILKEIIAGDFKTFYEREIIERRDFKYPPFVRLISITLKHKKNDVLQKATVIFNQFLKKQLGQNVYGPAVPPIPRLRDHYLMEWMIKIEKDNQKIQFAKNAISEAGAHLVSQPGFSGVRVVVDVDPA